MMTEKSTGKSSARAGAHLAKDWEDLRKWARARDIAERELYRLVNDVSYNEGRGIVHYVMQTLAHQWVCLVTLEELRALIIELKEGVGL